MTLNLRTFFFLILGVLIIWFLYIERAILTPFILAAIFAYIFNPIIDFISRKIRLPRTLSVILIYALIIGVVIGAGIVLSKRVVDEASELRQYVTTLTIETKMQISSLPDWVKPTIYETISSIEKSQSFSPTVFSLFPKAISRILSFVIFLFAAFYFLKEGRSMKEKLLNLIPNNYKFEAEVLLRKINDALGSYLRGQIFLVLLVSTVLFIALSILGVKFALILAVFSGFAEIVPLIGPIVAAGVAAIVAFLGGTNNFPMVPLQSAVIVVIVYTVIRQLQDYLVNPFIMGKITKLHPLVVLFAVLAGEHIAGILGLILAVPIASILKIFLEFSLDKINTKQK